MTQARAAKIPLPFREAKLIEDRRFRFDFYWPDARLALEIHGGTRSNGRHVRHLGFSNDREKMNLAVIQGFRVLEVTGEQVKTGKALDWVKKALDST